MRFNKGDKVIITNTTSLFSGAVATVAWSSFLSERCGVLLPGGFCPVYQWSELKPVPSIKVGDRVKRACDSRNLVYTVEEGLQNGSFWIRYPDGVNCMLVKGSELYVQAESESQTFPTESETAADYPYTLRNPTSGSVFTRPSLVRPPKNFEELAASRLNEIVDLRQQLSEARKSKGEEWQRYMDVRRKILDALAD